ncbi:PREDICTED: uncharacterized protein LOC109232300 isoform X2 [Nicotiana attenuata]|uniref:uncharacterized protein LOC109232300 isoform X2 n=1 Tax=Nicotiana attenuata TaxID=49451 RepID=UPI000905C66D|nr:PREDICTED: uncharacterized protein LOC109232300 isoform X2 [Nicotiana attenuata]
MEFFGDRSEKWSNIFLLEASGDSQSDSKIHLGTSQENFDEANNIVEDDDAESCSFESKDILGNAQEVTSAFEEHDEHSLNDEIQENEGHHCCRKEESFQIFGESMEEKEEDISSDDIIAKGSSRVANVEDEVERNRLFWETCFEEAARTLHGWLVTVFRNCQHLRSKGKNQLKTYTFEYPVILVEKPIESGGLLINYGIYFNNLRGIS